MDARRHDLDWLRIAAFALLIGYHVGMLYVPWAFHVKSAYRGGPWLTGLMLALNPWRLSLLFVISGAATAFMVARLGAGESGSGRGFGNGRAALARERTRRLLIPLLFGMLVVVVPQVYFEVVERSGYTGSLLQFWGRYLSLDQSFGTPIPTWNHLWFVAYLLVYTLIVLALAPRARLPLSSPVSPGASAGDAAPFALPHTPSAAALVALLIGPWFALWALRATLFPRFGSNHAMVADWYNHAQYFGMFLLGYLIARRPVLWLAIDRLRWPALGLAMAGGVVFIGLSLGAGDVLAPGEWQRWAGRAGREALAWGAVLAALGFGQRHLNHDHRWRAYLVEVIFAYYIVHQTALIALAVWLKPLQLGGATEAALIVAGTVIACVVTAEVVRRVRWLRPLFGFRAAAPKFNRPSPLTPSPPAPTSSSRPR